MRCCTSFGQDEPSGCDNSATEVNTGIPTTPFLKWRDILGSIKVRWGIGRDNYRVEAGLYRIGHPNAESPVLVTANYKLTFDALRKELRDIDAWILALDTNGVNVWCAAGKGTFGSDELVNRIRQTGLYQVVTHNKLILPQLGAVGVSANEVFMRTGFKVIYGPVRAADLPFFLKNDLVAEPAMRLVRFNFIDRIVLTPVELVNALKPTLLLLGVIFLANLVGLLDVGAREIVAYLGAVFVGCVLVPACLPYIPVKAFSLKGWILGLFWSIVVIYVEGLWYQEVSGIILGAAFLCILPAVAAYYGMLFTGSSTYTSMSGVQKEVRIAAPLIIASNILGLLLLLIANHIDIVL